MLDRRFPNASYLKLLNGLFAAGKSPEDMSEEEIKLAAEDVISDSNINQLLKNAKDQYGKMRKAGETEMAEKVELVEE